MLGRPYTDGSTNETGWSCWGKKGRGGHDERQGWVGDGTAADIYWAAVAELGRESMIGGRTQNNKARQVGHQDPTTNAHRRNVCACVCGCARVNACEHLCMCGRRHMRRVNQENSTKDRLTSSRRRTIVKQTRWKRRFPAALQVLSWTSEHP